MKKFALLIAIAATLVLSVFAGTARADYNTGWYCPNLGQVVDAGGGYAYLCRSTTHTWWVVKVSSG